LRLPSLAFGGTLTPAPRWLCHDRCRDPRAPGNWENPPDPRDRTPGRFPEGLKRLSDQGLLEKIGRGRYRVPGSEITEHQSLLEACKRVSQGVVCLLSALRFHGLTTQNPFAVWLAIDRKA
jgi:hypothetical protein